MTPEETVALVCDKNRLVAESIASFAKGRKQAEDAARAEKRLAESFGQMGEHEAVLIHLLSAAALFVDALLYDEAKNCYISALAASNAETHEKVWKLMGKMMTRQSLDTSD